MKTPFIITDYHGALSMNVLRDNPLSSGFNLLYKRKSGNFSLISNDSRKKINNQISLRNSILARWGNTTPIQLDDCIVYNNPKAMNISSSKGFCRKFLEEKGVPIPKTYLAGQDLSAAKYPLVGRPEKHGQGKYFYICANPQDVASALRNGCSYFSEVYPKTREFRVHVFMGKILAVMEKPAPDDNKIQWNHSLNNKPFVVLDRKNWDLEVLKVALQANHECGLDYSGVDLMAYPTDKSLPLAVVCELNTSPSLSSCPYMIEKYAKGFTWLFGSDEKRKHWDFSKFKRASSLAWKNYQLEPSFNNNNNEEDDNN